MIKHIESISLSLGVSLYNKTESIFEHLNNLTNELEEGMQEDLL